MKKVKILRGISGSGKSTYAKKHENAVVVSADHFFMKEGSYQFDYNLLGKAHSKCLILFLQNLSKGEELILVDNTNTTLKEIAPYAELALAFEYEVEVVTFLIPFKKAVERNIHEVPPINIFRQMKALENSILKTPRHWNANNIISE